MIIAFQISHSIMDKYRIIRIKFLERRKPHFSHEKDGRMSAYMTTQVHVLTPVITIHSFFLITTTIQILTSEK